MSGVITDSKVPGENCCWDKRTQYPVLCHVANHVLFAEGSSQKKDVMPDHQMLIKSVKNVSCVNQLSSVHNVTNVPLVAPNLPVGSRLHLFWEKWAALNVNPRVVSILREGYVLPCRSRPHLTREPTITSCYVDPHRNSYLLEALHQLLNKNAVELVLNQKSLGFYNRLFLVPKPNNRWRPILDLSNLNNFLKTQTFKMETPETIRTSLQSGEWVTSVDFKDAYFHIPINSQSRKYMRFQIQDKTYQFKALPFGLSTAPREFTMIAKEVKWLALRRGIRIHQYLDDWLVRAKSPQVCLQHTQKLLTLCKDLGWLVNEEKSELEPKQIFNFVGYQFDLEEGRVRPTQERWLALTDKIQSILSGLSGSTVHVPHWSPHSNRKTSSLGETTHEAHTVALEKQLEGPRVSGKGDPGSQVPPPPSKVVAGGRQCTTRSTFTPYKTCSANLYRRIKRRVGRSLRRAHCKRNLVSSREQITHKPVRAKSSIPSSKRLSNPRLQQDSVDSYRQHNSGGLYQQRGGDEVGLAVCPTVETTVLVHQATSNPQGTSHPRPVERDSRQAIQAWPIHSNRVVASSRSVQSYMQPVAPTPSGPVCHQIQQQTSSVCLTGTRSPGMGSGCPQPLLGGSGPIRLSTGSHLGQSGGEASGLSLQQNNSDCPRVAQHALVLGSGSNVKPDPTVSAQHTQPSVSAIQPGPSQEPVESESTCLAPRASAIKEQGFSEAVAARIEAPQRRSTRSVYEAKWTIFTKWCLSNQVDVRTPPLTAIADFLLHLFQDKKLQPGTIDGYRSAIADKLGNDPINISKDENLTRLLDSFHRDRPKGRRGIPSWNLSLVLHQLTKAPFEPLKEASLKHLTFKTVFLMALGSGKQRSEIHAWLHKNIRHQSDWSKVSLYPSPSFLSKNQLAREGPDSVAPVVIPALAPTLDKSLKGDRSLCPVRALRYYLDRTSDLRQNKELVFVSFKKGFDKDISPATVSSWIKQTVILCYELSDQQALTLHQVKAHDVRAFAASKAFQSGISLDQILSACHWKSHNTFTQFYLKDVAWGDSELFHLGPIVAAQQVHQQAL